MKSLCVLLLALTSVLTCAGCGDRYPPTTKAPIQRVDPMDKLDSKDPKEREEAADFFGRKYGPAPADPKKKEEQP
jgi:hypothetical protein